MTVIILPAFFKFAFVLLFFLMCEVLSEKEKPLRQMWALFPADGWVAQIPSALWLDFLAEKASLVVGLAQMLLPRKWRKLLIRKHNRTSYSWIYSVRDDMEGICVIYNSWIILWIYPFPNTLKPFSITQMKGSGVGVGVLPSVTGVNSMSRWAERWKIQTWPDYSPRQPASGHGAAVKPADAFQGDPWLQSLMSLVLKISCHS